MYKDATGAWWWSPDDNIAQAILDDLNQATKQIRFKMFAFASMAIADLLIAKFEAGVDVAGILDRSQASIPPSGGIIGHAFALQDMAFGGVGEATVIVKLRNAKIPLVIGNSAKHGQYIHEKAYCRDGQFMGTGSYNWSLAAQFQENHFHLIQNPGLSKAWLQNWNADWQRLGGKDLPPDVEPTAKTRKVRKPRKAAKSRVEIPQEALVENTTEVPGSTVVEDDINTTEVLTTTTEVPTTTTSTGESPS